MVPIFRLTPQHKDEKMKFLISLAMLCILTFSSSIYAQEISGFICNFASGVIDELNDGVMKRTTTNASDMPPITYSLNVKEHTAVMTSNGGASEVTPVIGKYSINFIEITNVGNLTTTTIYSPDSQQKKQSWFHAVHSRHIGVPDGAITSRYTGSCRTN